MKRNLGAKNALYPMPVVIVGCEAEGKPNFNTIAHVGIVDHTTLSISMGKIHYSNQFIKENRTLSVNLPSAELLERVDYVGIVSGKKADKSKVFKTFSGALKGAPMLEEAPLTMECEVIDIYDRPEFDVFIVRIAGTYCNASVMTDGKIDYAKVKPFFYDMPGFGYWNLGNRIMNAYTVGRQYNEE
ncbi:MAG: flavin reductase family protein [Selenomonas sp.]|nr:flavin reductase family protein [Selenomonas sp.]